MKTKKLDECIDNSKITQQAVEYPEKTGWYRIAEMQQSDKTMASGASGNTVQISLGRAYVSRDNESHLISLCVSNHNPVFKLLNTSVKYKTMTKIRYVVIGSEAYIEVYYDCDAPNYCYVAIFGQVKGYSESYFKVLDFKPSDNTGEVLAEYDL